MTRCIYCNKEKDDNEFSQEHVIPESIGGNLKPTNPFSTYLVCRRCNNISGLYIDAPFSKSWFINNYRSRNKAKFATITHKTILPLTYMGISKDILWDDKTCEIYLGPTGDTIYHFHDPYPVESNTPITVGVPPNLKNKEIDEGFAFLYVASDNPVWHPTIFYSFAKAFSKSKLFLGNGPTPIGGLFSNIPKELNQLHAKLKMRKGQALAMDVSLDAHFEKRFLAKIALGLGCIFLNNNFKQSEDADLLRKFMWTVNTEDRQKIALYGTGILEGIESLKGVNDFLNWEGCHVIGFIEVEKKLILYSNFYGEAGSIIQTSTNKAHWNGIVDEGMLYIIVPTMQKCVGPLHIAELIAHKYSDEYLHPELSLLKMEMLKIPPLPPFKIKNDTI